MTEKEVLEVIEHLPFQVEASSFEMVGESLRFILTFPICPQNVKFRVDIGASYPLHFMGHESISFNNEDLIEYNHIMDGGSLCLHSTSNQDPKSKLNEDISQLYDWIVKYYINKEKDTHYEDLVVNYEIINDSHISYIIPASERPNIDRDFGLAKVKPLSLSISEDKQCLNYLVYAFIGSSSKHIADNIKLSKIYCIPDKNDFQIPFVLIKEQPSEYGKFAIKDITSLSAFLTNEQLKFLNRILSRITPTNNTFIPVLIGYPTINDKLNWLALMIDIEDIPWHGEPEKINGKKTGQWLSIPNQNALAKYARTELLDSELFFGRGAFPDIITNAKILIVGIGAIGSILAKTFAKCGCKNVTLYDFDTKCINNCCRSEYEFKKGFGDKMIELEALLYSTNPFIEVNTLPKQFDLWVKMAYKKGETDILKSHFDSYDFIFDCSTDDDLAYILNNVELRSQIVNLSISNHANELVCAFSPNIPDFLKLAFSSCVSNNQDNDMYNPTGCWNPTFKASYNDINAFMQYAIKKIVRMLSRQEPKSNFIIRDTYDGIKMERI